MRTKNRWSLFSKSKLRQLVKEHGVEEVAGRLEVQPRTIRDWLNGTRAPNRRFQLAMSNLQDFTSLTPGEIGTRIQDFMTLTQTEVDTFASEMGVSTSTVRSWIRGNSRPRNLNRLTEVLTTPIAVS